tara:strand:- start:744 stop:1049 length:306 start_codon:yes stop_codon:yes gene_type:complete
MKTDTEAIEATFFALAERLRARPEPRHYYAVSYGLGTAVCANTGNRYAAAYHSFDSRAERDEYVSQGGDFRSSNDWRESLLASDRELKSELKHGGAITCRS